MNPLWWWLIGGAVLLGIIAALVAIGVTALLRAVADGLLEPEPLPKDEDEDN
ncbi:hypothetical protein ACSBPH_01690 [Microbacterium sp. F51-2R]|uniref:hypothetical protein n=1 Tax=Microbacterium sp. F51-2R TaxID=3445777 RepID=UPI003F9FFF14